MDEWKIKNKKFCGEVVYVVDIAIGGGRGYRAAAAVSGGRLGQRGRRRAPQNALQRPFARFAEEGRQEMAAAARLGRARGGTGKGKTRRRSAKGAKVKG